MQSLLRRLPLWTVLAFTAVSSFPIDRNWTASPYPAVSVIAADPSATESEAPSDTATFIIARWGSLDAPLTIKFNVEGTAKIWDDYTLSAGGSTWPYTLV